MRNVMVRLAKERLGWFVGCATGRAGDANRRRAAKLVMENAPASKIIRVALFKNAIGTGGTAGRGLHTKFNNLTTTR